MFRHQPSGRMRFSVALEHNFTFGAVVSSFLVEALF